MLQFVPRLNLDPTSTPHAMKPNSASEQELLAQMPYHEIERQPVTLPQRVHHDDYIRQHLAEGLLVPEVY